jgi:hypothetical protein
VFDDLGHLSKIDIKQNWLILLLAVNIEPILARHRKVIAIIYVQTKSAAVRKVILQLRMNSGRPFFQRYCKARAFKRAF